ncbi:MAG: hypothetical protein WCX81_03265 [Monoglobales bacterium]
MEKISVVLPDKYSLVVGDTFQLFYRGVISAPNPYIYDIVSVCEKGKNRPRYFEFTPEQEGKYKLTISVYGPEKVLLGQGSTILDVAMPTQPSKPVNVLCVGSSTTAGGQWPSEAQRRLIANDGEPKGNGLKDINFIGTCRKGITGYEGYGGWRWDSYYTTAVGAMWAVCNTHNKTIEDQHSLWQDEKGNIWQLETLAREWLKFNRYMQHKGDMPKAGDTLTHYKNATNSEPIVLEKTSEEKKSPFYDDESGKVDFKKYCDRHGFGGIDVFYIMLGGNGTVEAYEAGLSIRDLCLENAEKAKIITRLVHKSYPNARVRIMGMMQASVNGGCGTSYGAIMPACDFNRYNCYVLETNKVHQEWVKLPEFKDYVEFVNISGQYDVENVMPVIEVPVNTRSKKTEIIGINGLHPTDEGYMMVADAVYRNLVHTIKEL